MFFHLYLQFLYSLGDLSTHTTNIAIFVIFSWVRFVGMKFMKEMLTSYIVTTCIISVELNPLQTTVPFLCF